MKIEDQWPPDQGGHGKCAQPLKKTIEILLQLKSFLWTSLLATTDFLGYTLIKLDHSNLQSNSVQSVSHVQLFVTPWIAARQASLSITNSRSLLRLMSIESVMPSSHLILCHPLLLMRDLYSLPASGSFPMSQIFSWGGQRIRVSASASVLPVNTQDWSPLEWIGWISLQSKGLSRVFSNTTVQKHQFFGAQLSSQPNSHIHTWPLENPQHWLEGLLLAK